MCRELLFASRDDTLLMNNEGYIFIVRRLGKQSKLILSRLDSISNLKLNLRIHGLCGPDAHAGADLQVFLIFCFKPILLSAHKLPLLIYGDNTRPLGAITIAARRRRHSGDRAARGAHPMGEDRGRTRRRRPQRRPRRRRRPRWPRRRRGGRRMRGAAPWRPQRAPRRRSARVILGQRGG